MFVSFISGMLAGNKVEWLGECCWVWDWMAFDDAMIRQAIGAANSPQLVAQWQSGVVTLQQELIELSLVTGAQVTALTTDGEFVTQSHSVGASGAGAAAVVWSNLPEVR